jgi:hypothetical protein
MREKPEHVKRQYALGVSLGITGLIFLFWITSFAIGGKPSEDAVAEVKSPIASMTASAGDAFTYVKEMFFGKNKTTYTSDNVEVVGGKI